MGHNIKVYGTVISLFCFIYDEFQITLVQNIPTLSYSHTYLFYIILFYVTAGNFDQPMIGRFAVCAFSMPGFTIVMVVALLHQSTGTSGILYLVTTQSCK